MFFFYRIQLGAYIKQPLSAEPYVTAKERRPLESALALFNEKVTDGQMWRTTVAHIPSNCQVEGDRLGRRAAQTEDDAKREELIRQTLISYVRAGLFDAVRSAIYGHLSMLRLLQAYRKCRRAEASLTKSALTAGSDSAIAAAFQASTKANTARAAGDLQKQLVDTFTQVVDGLVSSRMRFNLLNRARGKSFQRKSAIREHDILLSLLRNFQKALSMETSEKEADE